VSEEAWQVFISILQAVRDEPFEDLSVFAQNPLGERDCIHRSLYDDGRNQAKRLFVLLDHRALADMKAAGFSIADMKVATSNLANLNDAG
jgi:hypothetical protein